MPLAKQSRKDSLFRAAKHSGKSVDRAKYNTQRNKFVTMIRQSMQSFFDKMDSVDSNNFWKFVCRLNQKQSPIATLQSNGASVETSANKATVTFIIVFSQSTKQ